MSLPDYSRYAEFYSYLSSVESAMAQRQEETVRAQSNVTNAQSERYADLYAELPEDVKAYYTSILEL